MAKSKLAGPIAAPTTIDLYGLTGTFSLPGSNITIRFLSTYASPSGDAGHVSLLGELMPMRERVKASELKDLTSLLQRDLNDQRVASELVPYLLGKRSPIGFFPAVLAVLVPKEFIASSPIASYPSAQIKDNITTYGANWSLERYLIEQKQLPLAMLKIAIPNTDVIVLDGQHRASAFRRVAGLFPPADSIYEAFYGDLDKHLDLKADLPVTLIWFESSDASSISPSLISRQLFVDVNNNAREVSKARTILLDDRHVSAIGTQECYRFAAEKSFAADRLSLLHTAFDMGVDLSDRTLPAFALTTPEIIDDALRWAFFGSTTYDSLDTWVVGRMLAPRNRSRFLTLFPKIGDVHAPTEEDEAGSPLFRNPSDVADFRSKFETHYRPIVCNMLADLGFLTPHYKASKEVNDWVATSANSTVRTVWSKVFKGGEGLYWIIGSSEDDGEIASYGDAIEEIEDKFLEVRGRHVGVKNVRTVNLAFEAFRSKAFQIGYLMAVDFLAAADGDWLDAGDRLIERLADYNSKQWVSALTEFRPLLVGSTGTTPRTWPAHRNFILRLFDAKHKSIYSDANWQQSPDWQACKTLLARNADGLLETNESMPDDDTLEAQGQAVVKKLLEVLRNTGLKPIIKQDELVERATQHLKAELEQRFTGSE